MLKIVKDNFFIFKVFHITIQLSCSVFLLKNNVIYFSSAGASSPAAPTNATSIDWLGSGQGSKVGSLSCIDPQPPRTSLSTNAGGSVLGSSEPQCRPWERGDLLQRLSTFKPSNWFAKPKVSDQASSYLLTGFSLNH